MREREVVLAVRALRFGLDERDRPEDTSSHDHRHAEVRPHAQVAQQIEVQLVLRHANEHLLGDLRDELRLAGLDHGWSGSVEWRVAFAELARERKLVRVRMRDLDLADRAVLFHDLDCAPV